MPPWVLRHGAQNVRPNGTPTSHVHRHLTSACHSQSERRPRTVGTSECATSLPIRVDVWLSRRCSSSPSRLTARSAVCPTVCRAVGTGAGPHHCPLIHHEPSGHPDRRGIRSSFLSPITPIRPGSTGPPHRPSRLTRCPLPGSTADVVLAPSPHLRRTASRAPDRAPPQRRSASRPPHLAVGSPTGDLPVALLHSTRPHARLSEAAIRPERRWGRPKSKCSTTSTALPPGKPRADEPLGVRPSARAPPDRRTVEALIAGRIAHRHAAWPGPAPDRKAGAEARPDWSTRIVRDERLTLRRPTRLTARPRA